MLKNLTAGAKALLLLSATLAAAPVPDGEPVSLGPLGGSAISVMVNPQDSDVILVIQFTKGLFRSTDAGATFAPFGTGISTNVRDLVQDPTDDQCLYVLDGQQVFKSGDFGATWSALSLVADEPLKGIGLPASGNGVLVYDAFNVYHSADAGANWSVAASVVPFAGTFFDSIAYAADGSVAYVGSNNGARRSSDGGASFAATSGSFTEWVQAVTVLPTDPDTLIVGTPFDGLFRSTDAGVNFAPVGGGVPVGNAEFFAWEPGGSRLWYAVLNGMYYSGDGGDTWTDGAAGWPSNTPIPVALALPATGPRYFGCEGGGLHDQSGGGLYRMDAGAPTSWVHIGFLGALINDNAIAGPGGQRVIGIGSGVYAGAPGQTVTPTSWVADIGTDTRAIAVDPVDSTRWVTGGVGAFLDNARIIVLTNDGANFAIAYEVLGAGVVQDIQFDPNDGSKLVAGIFPAGFGNEAIIRSSDGGDNWIEVAGTAGWATRAVAFDPFHPGRMLQLSDNNRWSGSLNSGQTWLPLQPPWPATGPAVLLAFDPFDAGVIYRGDTGTGLQRSDDDGANWSALGVSLHADSDLELHPTIPGLLWVSDADGQVLVSADRGDTFQVAMSVPLDSNGSALALDTADGSLLVGTTSASTWELPDAAAAVDGPWTDLGGGVAGINGVPQLTGGGTLVGGTPVSLTLADAPASVLVLLWVSTTSTPISAFGGTIHAFPFSDEVLLGTTPSGGFFGQTTWPTGLPTGTEAWFQFLVEDP